MLSHKDGDDYSWIFEKYPFNMIVTSSGQLQGESINFQFQAVDTFDLVLQKQPDGNYATSVFNKTKCGQKCHKDRTNI